MSNAYTVQVGVLQGGYSPGSRLGVVRPGKLLEIAPEGGVGDGLLLRVLAHSPSTTPTLRDYYNTGDNADHAVWEEIGFRAAQTFMASSSYSMGSVKIKAGSSGGSGSVVLSIQAVDGENKPDGIDLVSKSLNVSTVPTGNAEWVEFPFDSPISITQGTLYAIVVRVTDTALCAWRSHESANGYSDGREWFSTDGGTTWGHMTSVDDDLMFETYGTGAGGGSEHSLSSSLGIQMSEQGMLRLQSALAAHASAQLLVSAELEVSRTRELSSVILIDCSVSARMTPFWRAPTEAGMRRFLVVAQKNKLYWI